jgi:hypothetical protein
MGAALLIAHRIPQRMTYYLLSSAQPKGAKL